MKKKIKCIKHGLFVLLGVVAVGCVIDTKHVIESVFSFELEISLNFERKICLEKYNLKSVASPSGTLRP